MTLNVSLTPELETYIRKKVKTGGYKSASEVVREGLRILKERDLLAQVRLETLKKEIQRGLDSGRATPLDIEKIKKKAKKQRA